MQQVPSRPPRSDSRRGGTLGGWQLSGQVVSRRARWWQIVLQRSNPVATSGRVALMERTANYALQPMARGGGYYWCRVVVRRKLDTGLLRPLATAERAR